MLRFGPALVLGAPLHLTLVILGKSLVLEASAYSSLKWAEQYLALTS